MDEYYEYKDQKVPTKSKEEKKKLTLHVPCIGWIYSQRPAARADGLGNKNVRAPIIIYYLEAQAPKYKKRNVYFSFLDEVGSRLRANIAKGIRSSNNNNSLDGFNVHATNTMRYVFAVPKIDDRRNPGNELMSKGKNLYDHYNKVAIAPSFIASDAVLRSQGLTGQVGEVLSASRGNAAEKILYRNMVIESCSSGSDGKEENKDVDQTCTTNASEISGDNSLNLVKDALGWELHTFLQYAIDQTLANFTNANQPARFKSEMLREIEFLDELLLKSGNGNYGYGFYSQTVPRVGQEVEEPEETEEPEEKKGRREEKKGNRNERSARDENRGGNLEYVNLIYPDNAGKFANRPVLGMRIPTYAPPFFKSVYQS